MNLNIENELNIAGHLTVSKRYQDGSEEVVFDDHNIITSGMGIGLSHLFSLVGSDKITDFQIDRFQVGVGGDDPNDEIAGRYELVGALTALDEYIAEYSNLYVVTGHIIKGSTPTTEPNLYGIIPYNQITRLDSRTVRFTIVLDETVANDLQRDGEDCLLNEIGLFMKNIKKYDPPAPILVAYRQFSGIRKTDDFALVFRWSITF